MNRKEVLLIALCGIFAVAAIVGWSRNRTEPAAAPLASQTPAPVPQPSANYQPDLNQPGSTLNQPGYNQPALANSMGASVPPKPSDQESGYIPSDPQPVMIGPATPVSANYSDADRYATGQVPQAAPSGVSYGDGNREYHREHERSLAKSAAIIGGAAAGGAAIGAIAAGGKGAAIGAASGAGAGFVYDRATRRHRHHFWF